MPRFHFNIIDGTGSPDYDGSELDSIDVARLEAIRLAGAVLQDDAAEVRVRENWHMDVTDSAGVVLFQLDFGLRDAGTPTQRSG